MVLYKFRIIIIIIIGGVVQWLADFP